MSDQTQQQTRTIADEVPTNWCDPLLTGSDAVIGKPPYDCQDVERLLLAIKERVARALGEQSEYRRGVLDAAAVADEYQTFGNAYNRIRSEIAAIIRALLTTEPLPAPVVDTEDVKPCPHCLFVECQCSDFDVAPDMGARG